MKLAPSRACSNCRTNPVRAADQYYCASCHAFYTRGAAEALEATAGAVGRREDKEEGTVSRAPSLPRRQAQEPTGAPLSAGAVSEPWGRAAPPPGLRAGGVAPGRVPLCRPSRGGARRDVLRLEPMERCGGLRMVGADRGPRARGDRARPEEEPTANTIVASRPHASWRGRGDTPTRRSMGAGNRRGGPGRPGPRIARMAASRSCRRAARSGASGASVLLLGTFFDSRYFPCRHSTQLSGDKSIVNPGEIQR